MWAGWYHKILRSAKGCDSISKEYDQIMYEMVRRELAQKNYIDYLRYVHGRQWKDTKMAEFLADRVQEFLKKKTGNAYDIMIIETAPQHGKSMTITESLPSWYLGKYKGKRVIEVSYNDDTATRFLRRNKEKVKKAGEKLFGIKIDGADRADIFEVSGGGSMISRGITSGITGNPADLMIIDDPIKNREEADSETTRNKLWAEWLNTFKSRLSAGAKVIVIMTPWHEDDLRARIMATEQCVTRIRLPVEAEENDPMGRSPGDPLCPELGKDKKWLEQFKAAYLADVKYGPRAWSALYMCNPVIEGGNMVKREWWRYYDPNEIAVFGTECISVDATFKDKNTSDYVSIQVWGKLDGNYYLRYNCKEHLDFPATVKRIKAVRTIFPNAGRVYIEDKANGSAIIQVLQKQMTGIIPVNPMGGKVARVNAVSPFIETGHVFLPIGAAWLEDYVREWSEFPAGRHDDQVDASSQALSQLQYAWDRVGNTQNQEAERVESDAREVLLSMGDYDPYGDYAENTGYSDWYSVY